MNRPAQLEAVTCPWGWPAGQCPRTSRPGSGAGAPARAPRPLGTETTRNGKRRQAQLGPPGPGGGLLGRAFPGQHMHVTARGRHAPSRTSPSVRRRLACYRGRSYPPTVPLTGGPTGSACPSDLYGTAGLFISRAPLLAVMIVFCLHRCGHCRLALTTVYRSWFGAVKVSRGSHGYFFLVKILKRASETVTRIGASHSAVSAAVAAPAYEEDGDVCWT